MDFSHSLGWRRLGGHEFPEGGGVQRFRGMLARIGMNDINESSTTEASQLSGVVPNPVVAVKDTSSPALLGGVPLRGRPAVDLPKPIRIKSIPGDHLGCASTDHPCPEAISRE